MIYLDNAATSFPKPLSVWESINRFNQSVYANPGRGSHQKSLESAKAVINTRELIAKLFNAKDSSRIVFTLNCTEAINLALKGILKCGDHVIISSLEHNSVLRPLNHLKEKGIEFDIVRFTGNTELDLTTLEHAVKPETSLIVCLHASNVTGDLLPIAEIGSIANKRGVLFMVDAAQTAGSCKIDVERDKIDFLAFPGHKGLLGPQGTGGLFIREGIELEPLRYGGTGSFSEDPYQPRNCPERFESGTLNTPGIVGLGAGVQFILERGIENIRESEIELTRYLVEKIGNIEGIVFYGETNPSKKIGVVSFNFENVSCSEAAYVLDRGYGIATRSGLHCAPLAHKTIGTFPDGTVRVSVGLFNTKEDIDILIAALNEISKEAALLN